MGVVRETTTPLALIAATMLGYLVFIRAWGRGSRLIVAALALFTFAALGLLPIAFPRKGGIYGGAA